MPAMRSESSPHAVTYACMHAAIILVDAFVACVACLLYHVALCGNELFGTQLGMRADQHVSAVQGCCEVAHHSYEQWYQSSSTCTIGTDCWI